MTQSPIHRRFSKLAAAINQKATKLGSPGRITALDLAQVFLDGGRECAYCHIEVNAMGVSFDHVVPFAKGGTNYRSNIATSCLSCQRGKFTKSVSEWAQAREMTVPCEVCKKQFRPRWADYQRGYGRTCSRMCSGAKGGQAERLVG